MTPQGHASDCDDDFCIHTAMCIAAYEVMDLPIHRFAVLDRRNYGYVDDAGAIPALLIRFVMEEKILEAHKIISTPQRIEILRLIFKRQGMPFTVNDLKEDIRQLSIAISNGTLVTTIQLFHTRHLLTGSPGVHGDKGRPPMQYILARQAMDFLARGK